MRVNGGPERNPQHQLAPYARAVRRRLPLVVLLVLVVVGSALAVSLTATKQYEATARIFLSQQNPVENILTTTGTQNPPDPERDLNSRLSLITTQGVAQKVIRDLRLRVSTDQLLKEVSAALEGTSNIAAIKVKDRNPRRAADIANAFAREYAASRQEAARRTIANAASLAQQQLAQLSPAERASAQGVELARSARQLQVAAALQSGQVEIVSRAEVPESPASPRPLLNALLAAILGSLLAVGLAIGIEFLDRRLKDLGEVDAYGRPLLGTIPDFPGSRPRAVVEDRETHEALLTLATNLRFFNLGQEVETLAITSPGPQEGKTSVTLGVARALSELGLRVVTLECDLRRPTFSRYTGGSDGAGLSTVLAGVVSFDDALVDVAADTLRPLDGLAGRDVPYFSVLHAGPIPPNPQALLSSAEMAAVVRRARASADVVLLDTAPVDPVSDVVTIAELVGGIVLLARLGQTRRDTLDRALRTLDHLVTPVLGIVVTGIRRRPGERYGYDGAYAPTGRATKTPSR